LPVYKQRCF